MLRLREISNQGVKSIERGSGGGGIRTHGSIQLVASANVRPVLKKRTARPQRSIDDTVSSVGSAVNSAVNSAVKKDLLM